MIGSRLREKTKARSSLKRAHRKHPGNEPPVASENSIHRGSPYDAVICRSVAAERAIGTYFWFAEREVLAPAVHSSRKWFSR